MSAPFTFTTDDVESIATCPICTQLFVDARVVYCGASFCKACWDSLPTTPTQTKKCPNCRSLHYLNPPKALNLQRFIDLVAKQAVQCKFCHAILPKGTEEDHWNLCSLAFEACPRCDNAAIPMRHLKAHRAQHCELCHALRPSSSAAAVGAHAAVCPKASVACGVCRVAMARESMGAHHARHCRQCGFLRDANEFDAHAEQCPKREVRGIFCDCIVPLDKRDAHALDGCVVGLIWEMND